jgi:ribosomal protein S18 acetylase RimI-like enzyme
MTSRLDVEAIERATAAVVAPEATVEIGGWLATLSEGLIRRAKSATPLRHDLAPDDAALARIEALYAERGLEPEFRIAEVPGLAGVREALRRRGYAPDLVTLTMTGAAEGLRGAGRCDPAEIIARPDEAWGAVFLGEGFDPVDGAHRVAALSRSPNAVYARVREAGRTLAVGMAAFGFGWASVHGMRTDSSRRGEGLAGRVLAALADAALARGIDRVFLQVDEANTPAIKLYRRVGFETAWRYAYWRKPMRRS